MLARLWWKEYRLFGPVWLILVVAAGLLQWLFLWVESVDAKVGGLTVSAMLWALLYAFASGASTFSGERESKTLGFLDAVPVGRWTLWAGKASFALVSTFGLALVLAGMAALGTEKRDADQIYGYGSLSWIFGTMLFAAVSWSLFWSSLLKNPLMAGVLGVLGVYFSMVVADLFFSSTQALSIGVAITVESVPLIVFAGVALAGSALVMAWRPAELSRSRKVRVAREPATTPVRVSSTGRSLAWQAAREGWTTWLLVAAVGLVVAVFGGMRSNPFDGSLEVILLLLVVLVAGVSVFGSGSVWGTRRFLVHHGVGPAAVWGRRALVWSLALGSISALMLLGSWIFGFLSMLVANPEPVSSLAVIALTLLNAFAVGLLCGMTIPRRITAALVGVLVLVLVLPVQLALAINAMAPLWAIFLVPLTFVSASAAWSGDWLFEREGVRPWLKLGAWLVVPFALLSLGYVAYRAYSIEDVGPQSAGLDLTRLKLPPDEDAALAYGQANLALRHGPGLFNTDNRTRSPLVEGVIENGWNPEVAEVVAYWKSNQKTIDRVRRASLLPRAEFQDNETWLNPTDEEVRVLEFRSFAQLLALDCRERLARGDLPGAWDDILAQFRMAGQLGSNAPTMSRTMLASHVHHQAVGLGFDWLGAPGQSTEILGRALNDLKALPTLPNSSEALRVESSLIDRLLDRSGEKLAEALSPGGLKNRMSAFDFFLFSKVVAAPWERQRARRLCRLLTAGELSEVVVEPFQRGSNSKLQALRERRPWQFGEKLTQMLIPYFEGVSEPLDREVVGRRALDQAVAIEAWKLGHEGKYPDQLEALVPGLLPRLPVDPYSGQPFGYVRSVGHPVRSVILPDIDPSRRVRPTKPGQPLLYSIGPDRKDDGGQSFLTSDTIRPSDLVFPIP